MDLTPVTTICETGGCPRTLCVLATPRFQAPKERHMTAWGNAPGPLTAHISKALKGRNGCLYRPYRARPRRSGFPGALPQAVPSRPAGALHAAATRRGTTQHLGPTGVKCIALFHYQHGLQWRGAGAKSLSKNRGTAILAVSAHGQDARATKRADVFG